MSSTDSSFGKRVSRRRVELGLTQEQLARDSKLSLKTICSIEQELHENVKRSTLRALSVALGLGIEELDGKRAKGRA